MTVDEARVFSALASVHGEDFAAEHYREPSYHEVYQAGLAWGAARANPPNDAGGDSSDPVRLRAENEFLHKRRGKLVIERDRLKAALGQYPEGRDVMLAGTLAQLATATAAEQKAREALLHLQSYGCPLCNGDCAGANPPVMNCPMRMAVDALARPPINPEE